MKHGAEPRADAPRHLRWLWWLFPALLWLGSGALRVHLTLSDPEFDALSSDGLLKSDPGLLFYLTERVIDSGGRAPDDWRADRRIEHPDPIDIPATFTVGQEFLVAHAYGAFGQGMPLHIFCVWLMSFVASLAVIGVFGAAWALTGSPPWAGVAALLYALTPANYRTVGFILIREDLSLPLYSLHLWAFACAVRCHGPGRAQRPLATTLALFSLGAALATWHGMGFLVAIEGLVLLVAFVLTGANPLLVRGGRAAFLTLPVMVVLVPALRAKAVGAPPWMLLAAILWVCAWLPERLRRGRGVRLASVATVTAAIAGAATLGSSGDLSHVTGLLASKLGHLGRFPADPSTLPFDVRLLWQGPFETSTLASLWRSLLLLPVLLAVGMVRGWGARGEPGASAGRALAAFTALSLVAGWLVARTLVLTGLLAPICVAAACWRLQGPSARRLVMALVVAQVVLFGLWMRGFELGWYRPALRQAEIATMVEALEQVVPPGEAIAADFMNSTAILAHTGHPIVLQPKWERARSRERVELFWNAFYRGSSHELRELLLGEFDCRYLLVDRFTLWILRASRRVAGLDAGQLVPLPGSAAESLLDPDTPTEGFELIWRSPQTILQSNGRPSDFFRLYRLVD
ncbi:MAG: hypothetical protein ACI8QZ_003968 [Chlamydiales bacterium]